MARQPVPAPAPAQPSPPQAPAPPPPDRLSLAPADFAALPGWDADHLAAAVEPFRRSCTALAASLAKNGGSPLAGRASDWQPLCRAAATLAAGDEAARRFFHDSFTPWAASNHGEPRGLFTGYYEPTLHGSRRRGGRFTTPLYLRPRDLVSVDLGLFRDELAGKKIAGRLNGNRLEPYHDRAAITLGALVGRGLELVWVDDPIDAFFLEIQGSGRVELVEGGTLRVGYAGANGRPYFAIGKDLIDRGEIRREQVSMQSIRRWLLDHPAEARAVMNKNSNVVFFRRLEGPGPLGAQGLALTAERSLAIDTSFWPLGLPYWLATASPDPDPALPDRAFEHLVLGQDTGGAINGPVRGDVFWGPGREAAETAGRMKHQGRLWVLLPKSVQPSLPP